MEKFYNLGTFVIRIYSDGSGQRFHVRLVIFYFAD